MSTKRKCHVLKVRRGQRRGTKKAGGKKLEAKEDGNWQRQWLNEQNRQRGRERTMPQQTTETQSVMKYYRCNLSMAMHIKWVFPWPSPYSYCDSIISLRFDELYSRTKFAQEVEKNQSCPKLYSLYSLVSQTKFQPYEKLAGNLFGMPFKPGFSLCSNGTTTFVPAQLRHQDKRQR